MGILDRILRAGEGKKLKGLEGLVPDINARSAEMAALSDDALRGKTAYGTGRVVYDPVYAAAYGSNAVVQPGLEPVAKA